MHTYIRGRAMVTIIPTMILTIIMTQKEIDNNIVKGNGRREKEPKHE